MVESKADTPTRILLVEDEQDHVELIQRAFESWHHTFLIHVERSLTAAETYLMNEQPDIAIIDWLLPDGKGKSLLSLTTSQDNYPVIIMTSHGNEGLAVEMLKTGATDYVVKTPYALATIPQNVDRAIREFGHIQERKKAEEALRENNSRLEQMIAERTQELMTSNRSLEQFAYLASHDLQEPLRMITSYLQLLYRRAGEKLSESEQEYLDLAVDGSKRMRELLDSILMYSRLQLKEAQKENVDLNQTIGVVLENLSHIIEEKEAEINVDPLPVIRGESAMMLQLFQNLIGNGLKYCETQPKIHLKVESLDHFFHFSIEDNGIGIAKPYQKQIFEIFRRLHARDQYSGTGVGLAICKMVVDRHGGDIWVESDEGEGTTFHFSISKN